LPRTSIKANGLDFCALEEGSGGRPLLVLHGFCGAKENFEGITGPLAERGWHVFVPDQRGHGESAHPVGGSSYSFEHFAADALAIADVLGWTRFALLGHSMGGMTSQLVAIGDPQRLRGLVLMDTSHKGLEIDPQLAATGRQIVATGGMPALVEALRRLEGPLETQAHRRLLAERPGYQELLDAQTLAVSEDMWLAMSEAIFGSPDRLGELRSLAVPTLVIVGEQDAPFLGPSRRMAEAIPRARLAVVPDAGHSPQLESPDDLMATLSSFLDTL
jgi:pimeloyl-ACP methyl ester carboxylesterase